MKGINCCESNLWPSALDVMNKTEHIIISRLFTEGGPEATGLVHRRMVSVVLYGCQTWSFTLRGEKI